MRQDRSDSIFSHLQGQGEGARPSRFAQIMLHAEKRLENTKRKTGESATHRPSPEEIGWNPDPGRHEGAPAPRLRWATSDALSELSSAA